jgi:hypothetical protein
MSKAPVLLFSSDPFLGRALEAVENRPRSVVTHASPSEVAEWPNAAGSVVLDMAPGDRKAAYDAIRLHHSGRLIVVLGPDENDAGLPQDAARLTVNRPFGVASLRRLLMEPVPGGGEQANRAGEPDLATDPEPGGERPEQGNGHAARTATAASQPTRTEAAATEPTGKLLRSPRRPTRPASASGPRAAEAAGLDAFTASPGAKAPNADARVPAAPAPAPPDRAAAAPPAAAVVPQAAPAQAPAQRLSARSRPERPTTSAPRPKASPRQTPPSGPSTLPRAPSRPRVPAERGPERNPAAARGERPTRAEPPTSGPAAPAPAATPRPDLRGRAGNRPSLGMLAAAIILLTACLAGFCVWFALDMSHAARDLRISAQATRAKLDTVSEALNEGNAPAAETAIRGAGLDLDAADTVLERRPLRVAAHLPLLSRPVHDLERLLHAGRAGTRAAEEALKLYSSFGSEQPLLLRDGRFDFNVLSQATGHAQRIDVELASAERELRAVQGGPFEPGLLEAKQAGLDQIAALRARTQSLFPVLKTLPRILGQDRPKHYAIVLTNPAESRPGGGTPVAAIRLTLDNGVVHVHERQGAAAERLHHAKVRWTAVPTDPWRPGPQFTDFAFANSSPHFPTSGQELLRAYEAASGSRLDGVISVNPMSIRALLEATGPLTAKGWGQLTADNIGPMTMHDAFEIWPDNDVRQRENELLIDAVVNRFLDGKELLVKAKALGAEAQGRHLKMYFAAPAVQQVMANDHLDGALSPAAHDYLAVYTLNTNGSRVDYFQRRKITQEVRLEEDGSAEVTREVQLGNPTPSSNVLRTGPKTGYTSRYSTPVLAVYLPSQATLTSVQLNGQPVRAAPEAEAGRTFVRVKLDLKPDGVSTVRVTYRLENAAERTPAGLRYQLVGDPQPMALPPKVDVTVVPPPTMVLQPSAGWGVGATKATLSIRGFAKSFDDQLDLYRR